MILITYSTVRIVFNFYKSWHILLVSGFLITQAIFNLCIITSLENVIRPLDGFAIANNDFILKDTIDQESILVFRIIFFILGIVLLFLINDFIEMRLFLGKKRSIIKQKISAGCKYTAHQLASCFGKIKHDSYEKALENNKLKVSFVKPYHCKYCKKYHVGRRSYIDK